MSVGYDHIDVAACQKRNVLVGNTPGVLTNATADLTMALVVREKKKRERVCVCVCVCDVMCCVVLCCVVLCCVVLCVMLYCVLCVVLCVVLCCVVYGGTSKGVNKKKRQDYLGLCFVLYLFIFILKCVQSLLKPFVLNFKAFNSVNSSNRYMNLPIPKKL